MPIRIRIRLSVLMLPQMLENQEQKFDFFSQQMPVYIVFIFLVSVIGVIISCCLDSISKYSGNKYNLALHLMAMAPAPDSRRQALDADPDPSPIRPDSDPQH